MSADHRGRKSFAEFLHSFIAVSNAQPSLGIDKTIPSVLPDRAKAFAFFKDLLNSIVGKDLAINNASVEINGPQRTGRKVFLQMIRSDIQPVVREIDHLVVDGFEECCAWADLDEPFGTDQLDTVCAWRDLPFIVQVHDTILSAKLNHDQLVHGLDQGVV